MRLDDVVVLAQKGFRLFPVDDGGKAPKVTDWPNRATRNTAQLRRWWTQNPARNIGVLAAKCWPNGIENHLVVIDLDVKNGKDGVAAIQALAAEHGGTLPDTLTVLTPSGGRHLFYTVPEAIKTGVDVLAPGIDIRGAGGYVVGAGSEIGGNQYRFENPALDVAPCPDWLVALLKAAGRPSERDPNANVMVEGVDHDRARKRAIDYLATAPVAIEGAAGDQTTYKVAAKLKDLGCDEGTTYQLMADEWNDRCNPPWSMEELGDKVHNAYKYGREPAGSAAPEAVFDTVDDPLAGAESWTAEQIEQNAGELLQLRRRDPAQLDSLAAHWDMLAVTTPDALCTLLDETAARAADLDVDGIRQTPAAVSHPDNQKGLALLKRNDPEAFQRLSVSLAADRIDPAKLARATSAGERILRAAAVERARSTDPRALVRFIPGNAVAVADEIEATILKDSAAEPVFSFGSAYVTVRQSKPVSVRDLGGGEYPPMTVIRRYDAPSLNERITRSVRLESLDAKGHARSIAVPEPIVRALLSRQGGKAPPLTGIIEAPIVRRDGSILDQEGYDPKTGLFVAFSGAVFPPVEQAPAVEQAHAALEFLEAELLAEFPFASPLDRTATVAAVMTGLLRAALCDTAPGFLLSSPTQGTGKTALARTICHAAFGRPPAATSWPGNDDEMTKFLLGALREGQRSIVFDNIRDGSIVDSAQLATAMTSDTYTARALGFNETATVPTTVLWILTGNNLRLAGDMPSRVMEIYLDANDERPDQRSFRRDLVQWVAENRARIVHSVLTIVRAYFAADCPKLGVKETRFKSWDQMVRLPIIHAGGDDIGVKFDSAYQDDPVLGAWRDVLQAWYARYGTDPITVGQLLDGVTQPSAPFDSPATKLRDSLAGLLDERKGGKMTARSLGRIIGQFANRPAGGMRLRKGWEPRAKTNTWAIELCG